MLVDTKKLNCNAREVNMFRKKSSIFFALFMAVFLKDAGRKTCTNLPLTFFDCYDPSCYNRFFQAFSFSIFFVAAYYERILARELMRLFFYKLLSLLKSPIQSKLLSTIIEILVKKLNGNKFHSAKNAIVFLPRDLLF